VCVCEGARVQWGRTRPNEPVPRVIPNAKSAIERFGRAVAVDVANSCKDKSTPVEAAAEDEEDEEEEVEDIEVVAVAAGCAEGLPDLVADAAAADAVFVALADEVDNGAAFAPEAAEAAAAVVVLMGARAATPS
jgi:hypothetical protein